MEQNRALGIGAAFGAFALWGVLPLYWFFVKEVPAAEITLYRVGFAVITAWIIVLFQRRRRNGAGGNDLPLWPSWSVYRWLLLNGVVLVGNWTIYIWAVLNGHTIDASLGYYINPLVSVLFGLIVFQEKLSRVQWVAVVLAATGVVYQTVILGNIPWVSLALAFSFGFYGVIKKKTPMPSIHSIAVELSALGVIAVGVIVYGLVTEGLGRFADDLQLFGSDPVVTGILLGAGIVTVAPLLLFGIAAQNIRLSDVGFFQYLAPTLMLIIGITVFDETLDRQRLPGFILVWIALTIYTISTVSGRSKQ